MLPHSLDLRLERARKWNLGAQGFEAFMSIWRHCGGMMWNDLTLMIVDCWNQGEKSLNQIRPFSLMLGVVKVSVAKVPWYGTSCYFMATLWKKQGNPQTDGHGMWFSCFRLFSSFCLELLCAQASQGLKSGRLMRSRNKINKFRSSRGRDT